MTPTLLSITSLLLFICTPIAGRPESNIILSTITDCVTYHDKNLGRNATQTIPSDRLPTYSVTEIRGTSLVKTVVLVPQPYVTTQDVTRVFYEVTSVSRPDRYAHTRYTSTVTVQTDIWDPRTSTVMVTETASPVVTSTKPAFPGYTPLRAKDGSAAQRFIAEPGASWEVQDEYWNTANVAYTKEDILIRGNYPTAITCFFTELTASFYSTATLKRSVPQATYTRTRYVYTETWTKTVNVYPTPGDPNATIFTDSTTFITRSSYSGTVTTTETTTVTGCPSTTTVHAACATDNVINSYNVVGYDDIEHAYAFDALRVIGAVNSSRFEIRDPNATSALDCCTYAALEPNAWFYRYQHQRCNIWIGKECPAVANGTRGTAELWWSAQLIDNYWRDDSMVVGNGACGGIDAIQPYFYRD